MSAILPFDSATARDGAFPPGALQISAWIAKNLAVFPDNRAIPLGSSEHHHPQSLVMT
jgi:hypothetical protein